MLAKGSLYFLDASVYKIIKNVIEESLSLQIVIIPII